MAKRILIADDSVTIQKAFAMTFAGQDFTLMAAKSVDEALGLARQTRPDLVIADGAMPGKSGYDLCAALKADGNLRAVPVYVLASSQVPYDEGRGRQSGAEGSFTKPFETGVLLEKINEAIGRGATITEAKASPAPARPAAASSAAGSGRNESASARFHSLASPMGETVTAEVTISADPVARPAAAPALRPSPPGSMPSHAPAVMAPAGAAHRPTIMSAGGLRPAMIPGARPGMAPVARPAGALSPPVRPPGATAPPLTATMGAAASAPRPVASAAPAAASRTVMGLPSTGLGIPVRSPLSPAARPAAPAPVPGSAAPRSPASVPSPSPPRAAVDKVAEKISTIAARGTEYEAIAKLSREIIEQVVWEVVPELAEIIIRREVEKLKK